MQFLALWSLRHLCGLCNPAIILHRMLPGQSLFAESTQKINTHDFVNQCRARTDVHHHAMFQDFPICVERGCRGQAGHWEHENKERLTWDSEPRCWFLP